MNFGIPYFPDIGPGALAIAVGISFAALAWLVIRGVRGVLSAYDLHLDDSDDY